MNATCALHSENLNGVISEWMEACNSTKWDQWSDLYRAQMGIDTDTWKTRCLFACYSMVLPEAHGTIINSMNAESQSRSPNKKSPSFEKKKINSELFFNTLWAALLNLTEN